MTGSDLALALLLVPLGSAALTAFFFRKNDRIGSGFSVAAACAIAVLAGAIVFRSENVATSIEWLRFGDFSISLGFLVDDLSKLMLAVVAFIGLLIHIFSLGYMSHEKHVARFFACLSLFMFSMIGLTLSADLIMLFIFWELVGLSSFLLINFYYDRPSAVAASKKAFIVNRIGDFGFLLGIILAYWTFGTLSLTDIAAQLQATPQLAATPIALLLFCGAIGKSGQLPLHVWLPDAMEGPTPVSALIHAATMVAAGIFLLCRVSVVMTEDALTYILWTGVATALFAGITALGQRDIKRILAYSTISQLGFMVAGYGLGSLVALKSGAPQALAGITGGVAAAMFHLTTHAFFKALLFLGSGSIIHAAHHEQDIYKLGGLMKKMPVTCGTFTLGLLALIGAPFLSGFASKDAILLLALKHSPLVFGLLVFGAFLTALYMTRLWIITFLGAPRSENASHAHENGPVMLLPLILLSFGAVFSGYAWFYPETLRAVINAVPHDHDLHSTVVAFGSGAFVVGVLLGFVFYRASAKSDALESGVPALYRVLSSRFYVDAVYEWYVAKVQQRFAMLLNFLDQVVVAGVFARGFAGFVGVIGHGVRYLHTGNIQSYVYWFIIGLGLLWAFAVGLL